MHLQNTITAPGAPTPPWVFLAAEEVGGSVGEVGGSVGEVGGSVGEVGGPVGEVETVLEAKGFSRGKLVLQRETQRERTQSRSIWQESRVEARGGERLGGM